MKNAIVFYYNLAPTNIHQKGKSFSFVINSDSYILLPIENDSLDINKLYELSVNLFNQGVYTHQFVINKDRNLITAINNLPYVLFKVYVNDKRKITIDDIYVFNNVLINDNVSKIRRQNWYELWTRKIDYFEYQVNQLGKKHPLIRESFSYFVGLGENAISLVRDIPKVEMKVAHERIGQEDTLFDLYNPLNLIIDTKVRDACEYFKSCFFNTDNFLDKDFLFDDIKFYIENNRLTINECLLFLSRMFYPTFYFDIYENVLQGKEKEKSLLKVISRINEYEYLLEQIYLYLRSIMNVPEIEWLDNLR